MGLTKARPDQLRTSDRVRHEVMELDLDVRDPLSHPDIEQVVKKIVLIAFDVDFQEINTADANPLQVRSGANSHNFCLPSN